MRPIWKPIATLWLAGMCLRLTVLAVPPVIPMIHESLRLTQMQVGALVSLPVLLFSIAAVPGSLLIARFGAAAVLTAGIALTGIASALRGASFDVPTLFAMTFVMGAGIAIMQPALPAVVRDRLPQRIGFGTAVFSNGLLVGEALAASLTIPWVLPAVDQSWRLSLVAWSLPVLAVAALSWRVFPRVAAAGGPRRTPWRPDWRSPLTWRLGLIAGGCSSLYFATNAFLPDYLHAIGHGEFVGAALSALNWVQLPASFILLAYSDRLMLRRWPFVAAGALATVAIAGLAAGDPRWIVFWSGIVGFCTAFVLILTLALPGLLVEQQDVHRVSAAMFAIGYLCAIVTPVLGGLAWDITGVAWTSFLPAGSFGVAIIALAAGWDLRRRDESRVSFESPEAAGAAAPPHRSSTDRASARKRP